MNDDRVRSLLAAADVPTMPAPEFAAALLEDLREELGFAVPLRRGRTVGRRSAAVRPRGRGLDLLFVAALFVTGAVGFSVAAGAFRSPAPSQPADVLADIQSLGRIRIAVRPDHPQFAIAGQPAAGFDSDVAAALADKLGVRASVELIEAGAMLEDRGWDVALPSRAAATIDTKAFAATRPYYYWQHLLLVRDDSGITSVADLAGRVVCSVAGDGDAKWVAAPPQVVPVAKGTDADCLAELAAGTVDALLTAHLTEADVAVRSGLHTIDGALAREPRSAIVRRMASTGALLDAVDGAIEQLRRDGTLTTLSQNRFGGADLTVP
jgi:ABC-type amino acid transport substrate-binding protein